MYNHTLNRGKNHFVVVVCKLLVQKKCRVNDSFRINGEQKIKITKKG